MLTMIGLSKMFLNVIISRFKNIINEENKIYIKLNVKSSLNAIIVALKCMNCINYDDIFNFSLSNLPESSDNAYEKNILFEMKKDLFICEILKFYKEYDVKYCSLSLEYYIKK